MSVVVVVVVEVRPRTLAVVDIHVVASFEVCATLVALERLIIAVSCLDVSSQRERVGHREATLEAHVWSIVARRHDRLQGGTGRVVFVHVRVLAVVHLGQDAVELTLLLLDVRVALAVVDLHHRKVLIHHVVQLLAQAIQFQLQQVNFARQLGDKMLKQIHFARQFFNRLDHLLVRRHSRSSLVLLHFITWARGAEQRLCGVARM